MWLLQFDINCVKEQAYDPSQINFTASMLICIPIHHKQKSYDKKESYENVNLNIK
jgi:hypothetical protein